MTAQSTISTTVDVPIEYQASNEINQVQVIGSWNHWSEPVHMERVNPQNNSTNSLLWKIVLKVPPGIIRFRFLCDSNWITATNYDVEDNGHGGLNNRIIVKPPTISLNLEPKKTNQNVSIDVASNVGNTGGKQEDHIKLNSNKVLTPTTIMSTSEKLLSPTPTVSESNIPIIGKEVNEDQSKKSAGQLSEKQVDKRNKHVAKQEARQTRPVDRQGGQPKKPVKKTEGQQKKSTVKQEGQQKKSTTKQEAQQKKLTEKQGGPQMSCVIC